MKPNPRFLNLGKDFWANIRTISEATGYRLTQGNMTLLGQAEKRIIKVPTPLDIKSAYEKLGLSTAHILEKKDGFTDFGKLIRSYFEYRADVLVEKVEPNLMNMREAKAEFERLRKKLHPKCPIPMNKQKGEKKAPAYFTGIINMLIEANSRDLPTDYDPHHLTTVTRESKPLRTLSRRVDGAFPMVVNPIAIWEIKEYYYTTTFGSRVADGVYESLLDGMELEELYENENVKVRHYLMIDAYSTWWNKGISFLCRIIDMLQMGYVDEVLVGREVLVRLPELVKEWVEQSRRNVRHQQP